MAVKKRLSNQAVGAYGEKAVEAELLRRQWIPSNVNATVKNAAEYDLIAQKEGRVVLLRVKTSGPNQGGFQFNLPPGRKSILKVLKSNDFTALVSMGDERDGDRFFIVPTRVVRKSLNSHMDEYLGMKTREGQPRKDTGQWTLHWAGLKSGARRHSHGYEAKWQQYRDAWDILDKFAR
jgi:hypothetical protein